MTSRYDLLMNAACIAGGFVPYTNFLLGDDQVFTELGITLLRLLYPVLWMIVVSGLITTIVQKKKLTSYRLSPIGIILCLGVMICLSELFIIA